MILIFIETEPTLASIEKFVLNMINTICKIANFHQVICHSTTYQCFFIMVCIEKGVFMMNSYSFYFLKHSILTSIVINLKGKNDQESTKFQD